MSKKNSRHCPALQSDITSKECGNDRHSRIPCTADCPFNPFALENYDDLLLLEKAAEAESAARLLKSMTPARHEAFAREARRLFDDPFGMEAIFREEYIHRLGPDGLNFMSRWEASGWAGLKNDHRIYFQGHRQLAPMLVEYQGPLDADRAHALDLLHTTELPLLVLDRVLVSIMPRFTTVLVWQFPLPHYHRFFGVNLPIHPLGSCMPLDAVREIVRHLGGPVDQDGLLSWLNLNFLRFVKACHASLSASNQTRERIVDRRHFISTWKYTCPLNILLDHCNASPLLTADWPTSEEKDHYTAAYQLLAPPADLAAFQELLGANIAGRLLITHGEINGFSLGEANHHHLRTTVELAAGSILSKIQIEIEEIPREEPLREAFDRASVPARFMESSEPYLVRVYPIPLDDPESGDTSYKILGEILTDSYRAFVDATPPELGGLTVHAAAALPAHRPCHQSPQSRQRIPQRDRRQHPHRQRQQLRRHRNLRVQRRHPCCGGPLGDKADQQEHQQQAKGKGLGFSPRQMAAQHL